MIVLDTNQLHYLQPPVGPLHSMLKRVAFQTGHALAVPEVALEEHLAHYAREVEELHQNAKSAMRSLNAKLRTPCIDDLGALNLGYLLEDVGAELRDIFTVLPTPEWAARESLLREARRLAPAKRSWDGKGEGARDAAIWLTAIHALRESDETLYFVSMDKRAFGEGTLLPDLNKDLSGAADRFKYCYGIDALLKALAQPYPATVKAEEIGSSDLVNTAVRRAIEDLDFFTPIIGRIDAAAVGMLHGIQARKVHIAGMPQVISYEVDGQAWACARVRWNSSAQVWMFLGHTPALVSLKTVSMETTPMESRSLDVSFSCSTTLLMELDGNAEIAYVDVTHIGDMRDFRATITR